ncbi:MAG: hypothetical protein U9N73_13555 [Candidatus Auribacterota bacterium]|nr:hypothetical protein [Candidatus Auribacterota bacterium]
MKRSFSNWLVFTLVAAVILNLTICLPILRAGDLKIMSANVSKVGTYAREESIRIFQGMDPDVILLQEWVVTVTNTYRNYVDEAFGADFYYYLGESSGTGWGWMPNGIVSRWEIQTAGSWEDTSIPEGGKHDFAWASIDLPGNDDLLAVSVHLKPDAGEEARRVAQAEVIKDYVEGYLALNPSSSYVVVGGDLNTESQYEWCIQTFATFLEPTNYRPADRLGDENTNQNRDKPYDWIMPNQTLDNLSDTLYIGDVTPQYEYEDGIVFDSHVFSRWSDTTTAGPGTPLWNLPPVLYGDSHSSEMDHLGVMKVFDVFPSPTPSVTPTTTVPPTPTRTPTPIPTPTPTLTPEIIPTPSPSPTQGKVIGPISGRVYDRVTGEGIPNVYVRALGGSMSSAGISDNNGDYTTGDINADVYTVFADIFLQREYAEQYYDQRPTQSGAAEVPSNSSGIDFPLYKKGVDPTPTVTPTPRHLYSSIDSGDYDGDGTSDIAIFRPSSGLWAIQGVTRMYFGGGSDQPAAGDYDGDGTSDIAIFRDSSGLWAVRGISRAYFGAGADIPVPGDYNGDGSCDIAIFRDSSGLWAVRDETRIYFGAYGDIPVPYNGAQLEKYIAIYRPSSGLWAVKNSTRCYFGGSADQPIPANYEGLYPHTAQLGIYRGTSGLWAIRGITRAYYGNESDQPVPGNYQGQYTADITIFRDTTGLWAVRGLTRLYFGNSGDIPVAGLAINPSSGGTP